MKYSKCHHYKYKLEENERVDTGIEGFYFDNSYYCMLDNGWFLVKRGYAWDGSSIPYKKQLRVISYLNPLVWVRIKDAYDADKYCKDASLIHDALCQAMREGQLPPKEKPWADDLYYSMCIAGGMSIKQAGRRFKALREFGDSGIKPEKKPRNKIYDTEFEK